MVKWLTKSKLRKEIPGTWWTVGVLVAYRCGNKSPQTQWLRAGHVCHLTLWVRSSRRALLGLLLQAHEPAGVGWARFHLKAGLGKDAWPSSHKMKDSIWWAVGHPHFLAMWASPAWQLASSEPARESASKAEVRSVSPDRGRSLLTCATFCCQEQVTSSGTLWRGGCLTKLLADSELVITGGPPWSLSTSKEGCWP